MNKKSFIIFIFLAVLLLVLFCLNSNFINSNFRIFLKDKNQENFSNHKFTGFQSLIEIPDNNINNNINIANPKPADCLIKEEERIVHGNSLSPLIKSGQTIKVLFNYYHCHSIQRDDIVLFDYVGNKNPLIKIIKGIPGDKFELKKSGFGWNIVINNQIVKNSENKPYFISGKAYQMLSLYEKDYKGRIPENAYLLFGDIVSGSTDSTAFGLVNKNNILGKLKNQH